MLTQAELKKIFSYDPLTGLFIKLLDNKISGGKDGSGYIDIYINRVKQKAHRLAWLYMTGKFPEYYIDHINGIKSDNRFINLRECTAKENIANTIIRSNNSTGFKGVVPVPSRNLFKSQIRVSGKAIHLGYFSTALEASNAYEIASLNINGEFHKPREDYLKSIPQEER